MSWTDKKAVEVIKYLRDKYEIKTLVETGTFKGINARLHSKNFELVITCENHKEYYKEAKENLKNCENVIIRRINSPEFLLDLRKNEFM